MLPKGGRGKASLRACPGLRPRFRGTPGHEALTSFPRSSVGIPELAAPRPQNERWAAQFASTAVDPAGADAERRRRHSHAGAWERVPKQSGFSREPGNEGMPSSRLCLVRWAPPRHRAAERPGLHSQAEPGNEDLSVAADPQEFSPIQTKVPVRGERRSEDGALSGSDERHALKHSAERLA